MKKYLVVLTFCITPLVASAETLTLDEAVREAIQNNPEVRAARSEAEAARARVRLEKSLDDPMITVMAEEVPIDSADPTRADMISYGIRQTIPFPGKRFVRGKAARLKARAEGESARDFELSVLEDLKGTYYEVYRIDRSLEVNRGLVGLFGQLLGSTKTAYAAGKTTAEPALKARVELSMIENEQVRLELERTTHAAHLNALMGREVHRPIELPASLSWPRLEASFEEIEELAFENRPMLVEAQGLAQSARSDLTRARQGLLPDFTLEFEYNQRPNVEDAWSGQAMINLPIWFWGKNRAQIREAKAMHRAASERARSMKIHTTHEVAGATSAVQAAEQIVGTYRKRILPEAKANLEAARLAFGAGKADLMTLVDAARTYRMVQKDYYSSEAEYGTAFARLEHLVGYPLAEKGGRP